MANIPGFSRLFLEDTVPTSAQLAGHNKALQHNQIVMQMNGVRHLTSGCVQRRVPNVVNMIDEPGCSAGDLEIPFEQEMNMLKTISAALLAVSVLAAPVLAAESGKTTANASIIKTTTQVKPAALNANAKMGKQHYRKHFSHHHRHHSKMAAIRTTQPKVQARATLKATTLKASTLKTAPKASLKPAASMTRRG